MTMYTSTKSWKLIYAGAALLALAGCGGGGGGGGGGSAATTAGFSITDAPVDNVEQVHLTISGIALKPLEGEPLRFDFDTPVVVENLLELTGTGSQQIVSGVEVEPGEYSWLRLYIPPGASNGTYVVEDGSSNQLDLLLPGSQGGNPNDRFLHLNSGFTIPAGGQTNFTIDFVMSKALTKPSSGNDYLLRPAMRLVDNVETGVISGTVDESLVLDDGGTRNCTNDSSIGEGGSVYLYAGDVQPDDFFDDSNSNTADEQAEDVSNARPLTAVDVVAVEVDGVTTWEYEIGFVAVNDIGYTVAYTCQANTDPDLAGSGDNPEVDDDITFEQPTSVQVTAGETTEQNFEAPAPDPEPQV